MVRIHRFGFATTLVLAGSYELRAQTPEAPEPLNPPALEAPADGTTRGTTTQNRTEPADRIDPAQALPEIPAQPQTAADRVYVTKAPPAVVIERPAVRKPSARAIWVPGNWEWDATSRDFVWVPGSWQGAPKGTRWVSGQWQRDERGWYWSPGYWGGRPGGKVAVQVQVPTVLLRRPAWRIEGPPARQPAEVVSVAPGQDYFFIPGHYRPDGQTVIWKPGMWAREQPGWEWVSARWIRRPDGWDYRLGFWARDPDVVATSLNRSQPRAAGDANLDTPPPLPPGEGDNDPIAAGERLTPVDPDAPVAMDPVTGMPYYMIRPPGSYPYGRGGVVVPGAVPPFVRNLLDRVLP